MVRHYIRHFHWLRGQAERAERRAHRAEARARTAQHLAEAGGEAAAEVARMEADLLPSCPAQAEQLQKSYAMRHHS